MKEIGPSGGDLDAGIAGLRSFTRFFTGKMGVLREGLLGSPYSLTEARVIFELSQASQRSASDLCQNLGLDPGYLSRILGRFEKAGLVERTVSQSDSRRRTIALSPAGRSAFELLDSRSRENAAAIVGPLDRVARAELLAALRSAEALLGGQGSSPLRLRDPEPGDLGWVVERHGAIYEREYGWDSSFEALVARIVADYAASHDPGLEKCWIAELHGKPVGSVFVVKSDEETAKLRLLLVEPDARGLGLGKRLVDECVRFSRDRGYRKLVLWTNSVLTAARAIYAAAGFILVASEAQRIFGADLVSETWELAL